MLFTITEKHEVKEGVPTLYFFYTFNSDTVSKPVLTMLGLKWFRTKGLTASDLHAIPGMPEAMAEVKAEEMEDSSAEREGAGRKRWRHNSTHLNATNGPRPLAEHGSPPQPGLSLAPLQ